MTQYFFGEHHTFGLQSGNSLLNATGLPSDHQIGQKCECPRNCHDFVGATAAVVTYGAEVNCMLKRVDMLTPIRDRRVRGLLTGQPLLHRPPCTQFQAA